MLLFKKIRFLPLRIGLNLILYGMGGTFVLSMFAVQLPEPVADYAYLLVAVMLFAVGCGALLTLVAFPLYLIRGYRKLPDTTAQPPIPSHFINPQQRDTLIPTMPEVTTTQETVKDKTVLTIRQGQNTYVYTQLERVELLHRGRYDYALMADVNGTVYYLYFSEIPVKEFPMGWHVMLIERERYVAEKNKELLTPPKSLLFLGQTPLFREDAYLPYIVVTLMNTLKEQHYAMVDGVIVKQDPTAETPNEVILYEKPLRDCRGDVEPTDFRIRLLPDKVEIRWGVGWCGGQSHADGAGNIETLPADYFSTHTHQDFIAWLNSEKWGQDFVRWLDLENHQALHHLFLDATIKALANQLRRQGYEVILKEDTASIVLQRDDPWNHFNKFVAKPDGVYNYIERTMSSYQLTKRLSCPDLSTATLLMLAYFLLSKHTPTPTEEEQTLLAQLRRLMPGLLPGVTDAEKGAFILEKIQTHLS